MCFNCCARVLFCNRLSSTQFINTSNPLTHHRSRQTAADLKKVQNIPEDFYSIFVVSFLLCSPEQRRIEQFEWKWKSMKLGEKLSGRNFTSPLAFSQPQRALYGNTWIYMAIQCRIVLCWMFIPFRNFSLVLTGSFCLLRNVAKVFDLLIIDSILQLISLA